MNLLPLAMKVSKASMSLDLTSVKPMNLGDFKIEIVYPTLLVKAEAAFVMSNIKHLMEKINNKHCQ